MPARHALGVEGVDRLLVHQDVAAARLGLQVVHVVDQLQVVAPERRAGLEVALGQAEAQKDLARLGRVDRAVVDPPSAARVTPNRVTVSKAPRPGRL
jgi:hypothetical protein